MYVTKLLQIITGKQNLFGFEINSPCNITIKTCFGKYVSADGYGQANANQNKNGQFETWTVGFHGKNKVTFKSGHQKYLVAETNGDINANRDVA